MGRAIEDIRKEIDAADDELLTLIQRRFELAREIGVLKNRDNLDTFNPSRETAIIERLAPRLKPPVTRPMLEAIFAEIFSISRSLQKKTRVAYLGPEGSYSHQATRTIFNLDAELIPRKDIESVINEVLAQRADLGIVPVENSTEGMINQTLDMMATSRLFVCREIMLPIRNCLLSGTTMDRIRRVYSHPQALAQCRKWIMENLPQAETVETASTSIAALTAKDEDGGAAIASSIAAEIYGLDILACNINDIQENITRFWVISRTTMPIEGNAKTSIIVTLENIPGALHHAVGVFAGKGINLTKIESRPSRKNPWEYIFFIDFQGNLADANVKAAMEEIRAYTSEIIILGSYPEGRISE